MIAARPRVSGVIFVALALVCCATGAEARPGDWDEPLTVRAFPFVHASDTTTRDGTVDAYDCASTVSEAGPEVLYRVEIDSAGRLTAWVEGDDGTVDVDVQILDRVEVDGFGTAAGCLDRGNHWAEAEVGPGVVFVAVDTWEGAERAGPYRLQLDLQPVDAWYEREVAAGVHLRTRTYADLFGDRQTVSVLDVDLGVSGVSLRPLGGTGCALTSEMGRDGGAMAAVNGGFFGPGDCPSESLLKIDGELIATNRRTRTAFGLDDSGAPTLALVPADQDWPDAEDAVGGVPRIATSGAIDVRTAEEGASSAFETTPNPRTAVGIGTSAHRVILATVDGRTDAGAGMTLPQLAEWMIGLGAQDALNLDGGGSTTLWVERGPFDGVVNYPSDNRVADHDGERLVGSALGVFAPPLEREVLWLTDPPVEPAVEGDAWVYEVVAADPDGVLASFDLEAPDLAGDLVLDDRGDGTARLTFTPAWPDGDPNDVVIEVVAFVGSREGGRRALSIDVAHTDGDGDGLPDGWEIATGLDPTRDDASEDPDGDGKTNADEYLAGTDPLYDDRPSEADSSPDVGSDVGDSGSADLQADGPGSAADGAEGTAAEPSYRVIGEGCGCSSAQRNQGWPLILWGFAIGLIRLARATGRRGRAGLPS